MNRALRRVSLATLVLFVALLININYVQAFQVGTLAAEPGNIRTFNQQFTYQRGAIVAAGNVTIADSRLIKGTDLYKRHYPFGPLYAPVTGYDSIYGETGIELAENRELSGSDPRLAVHNLIDLVTGKPKAGAKVYLTLVPRVQQAAYQGLQAMYRQGHSGAAVAIDPATGAILAMASVPTFNPNDYTTMSGRKLNRIDRRYRKDPAQPLLNRAINETYPPGSSFKIITSSAAFAAHKVSSPQSTVPAPQPLTLPNGNKLNNDGGEICGNGHPPLIQAFWMSCNTAFGGLGIKLSAAQLRRQAEAYWINKPLSIPLQVSPSAYPLETDPSLRALSAIGQLNDQLTPLQEAMDSAAVADNGTLMRPYLVQQVQAPDLSIIQSATPSVLSRPVSPQIAGYLRQMMVQVTNNTGGTAFQTANKNIAGGIVIAGKTGTAENTVTGAGLDDAVFTCFAPAGPGQTPKIAVGVIVKGAGFGAAAAAPIAVAMVKAYLLGQG